jgi:uncharacterized protein (UPF0332 family)
MTLSDEDRAQLVKYNIEKSNQAIEDVKFLMENGKLYLAANRIYYGIFYILSALALKHRFSTKNHGQLIGWFNRNFVKTGKVDKKYSNILRQSFELRSEADYDVLTNFNREEIEQSYAEMIEVISKIKKILEGSTDMPECHSTKPRVGN